MMLVMVTGARALVTEAEFLSLPESTRPAEFVDGEVVMAPSPSAWHQQVLIRMVSALAAWGRSRDVTVLQAPMDVRFGAGRILQPDAMVFAPKLPRDVATPIAQIPILCVEVLSSNRTYDRVTKRILYSEAGVKEYWLIDPAGIVERRTGADLLGIEEIAGDLDSPLLSGFSLRCSELFE